MLLLENCSENACCIPAGIQKCSSKLYFYHADAVTPKKFYCFSFCTYMQNLSHGMFSLCTNKYQTNLACRFIIYIYIQVVRLLIIKLIQLYFISKCIHSFLLQAFILYTSTYTPLISIHWHYITKYVYAWTLTEYATRCIH